MQTPRRALVISIHDVSPLTCRLVLPLMADIAAAGVDQVALLVIPNHHSKAPIREDAEFCNWLRGAVQTHEVVLHGYFHSRPRNAAGWWVTFVTEHYTAQEGEFYDLSEGEARLRLERGKREFAELGLVARGFIAPAWLLGREAERAVRGVGFQYTTRLRTFKDLVTGRETISHSLVWSVRSAWRRVASLCWNELLARRLFGAPLLRIGLHPVDWQHDAVRRQALHLVRSALAAREAITYEGWLARLRSEQ
jgi:predicted deacetylase